jgi:YebC/PmpR family DNA-binding regulatory protein
MSGHSKWSNIKVRKGAQDKKRGEAFARASKDILIAIRSNGGDTNTESNLALKMAIDRSKGINMPKENVERLIKRFEEKKTNLSELVLEGYGPFGVPLIIETETDNRNRILAEMKLILKKYGGSLAENGSVMFQFKRVGEIEFEKIDDEGQLELIDLGVSDLEKNVAWIEMEKYNGLLEKLRGNDDFKIISSSLIYKTDNPIKLEKEDEVKKILNLIDDLEENEDVVGVSTGFDYN